MTISKTQSKVMFRDRLNAAGLTQTEFSRLLGVSIRTVNRWHTPRRRADALKAPRYALAFLEAFTLLTPAARVTLAAELAE